MARGPLLTLFRQLRPAGPARTDHELLTAFAERHDEAAFAALLERHGPLVWHLCRRLLTQDADAEDAFQATFLVLARSAGAVRRREHLAGWLAGVARRVALKARARAARPEAELTPAAVPDPAEELARAEACAAVAEELAALPRKYRDPVVLCHLQGRTHREAAGELGWPSGSLSYRLRRGLDLLKERLERRGVGLALALLGTAGAVPAEAAARARRLAALVAAGEDVSGPVAGLAEGVLTMSATRRTAVVLLGLGVLAVGAGGVWAWTRPAAPGDPGKVAVAPPMPPQQKVKPLDCLERAEESALQIADAAQRATTLADIGFDRARTGDPAGARRVLAKALEDAKGLKDMMVKQTAFQKVALAYLRLGDPDAAVRTARAFGHDFYTNRLLHDIVRAQAKGPDLAAARRTVDLITDSQKADALTDLAVAQAKAGDRAAADRTMTEVPADRVNSHLRFHGNLAAWHAEKGRKEESAKDLAEARRWHEKELARETNERTRHVWELNFAYVEARAGDEAAALARLKKQYAYGKATNTAMELYHQRCCEYLARVAGADRVIAFAREPFGHEGFQAWQTFSTLQRSAAVLDARGDHAGARKVREAALKGLTNDRAVDAESLALLYAQLGEKDTARTYFQRALEQAKGPQIGGRLVGVDPRAELDDRLCRLARAQALGGDAEGALATLRETADTPLIPTGESATANVLTGWGRREALKYLARAGDAEAGMAHTLQVATPVLRTRAYLGIAEGLLPAEGEDDN